jgi:hypothetical protein
MGGTSLLTLGQQAGMFIRMSIGSALRFGQARAGVTGALFVMLSACAEGNVNPSAGGGASGVAAGSGGMSSSGGGSGGSFGSGSGGSTTTGSGGRIGSGGSVGSSGGSNTAGAAAGGTTGSGSSGGTGVAGTGGKGAGGRGTGTCCPDGNCLCHGPDPTGLTSGNGPYKTATFTISTGTVYHPTDAEPPFAGVALCGGFLNTGPEMAEWGTFYASHGIVTVIATTGAADLPDLRATELLAAIEELKGENTKSGSALMGKLAGRYGTSGYSMGGGATTIASGKSATLLTSVGLAAWGPNGAAVQVPTLLLCGGSDTVAPCDMTDGAYTQIPEATRKMKVSINGVTHFDWFGPTNAGGGTSGKYALAFQKVFLEGDQRWKPHLLSVPTNGTATGNIK